LTLYRLRDGESLDRALNRFRRKVAQAGITTDVRRRRYYLKPSEARRAKERAAALQLGEETLVAGGGHVANIAEE
jgi:small subunit ribosomal protein S21